MMESHEISIRPARREDTALILEFIRGLADYEHMSDQVVADPEILADWLFEKRTANVVFALCDGKEAGFALYFHNFSTFLGRAGIYLEDLYVMPEYRGRGLGKALMRYLAGECVRLGCGRLEWACLDWNRPSIDFYLSLQAVPQSEWTTYRLTGDALKALAESAEK